MTAICALKPGVHLIIAIVTITEKRLWKFFERLERLNGHDSAITQRSQGLTAF